MLIYNGGGDINSSKGCVNVGGTLVYTPTITNAGVSSVHLFESANCTNGTFSSVVINTTACVQVQQTSNRAYLAVEFNGTVFFKKD